MFWGAGNRNILSHGAEDTADLLCDLGQLAQHLRLQFSVLNAMVIERVRTLNIFKCLNVSGTELSSLLLLAHLILTCPLREAR